ncbi:DUF456 domain-containing protein [Gordonia sinesedis]
MPLYGDLLVALGILVGLVGIVVPVLPGGLLVAACILVWAAIVGGWAWLVFAVAAGFIALGTVVKYLVAGRKLRSDGIPNRTIMIGGLVGIVGFFVIPVVGLFVGFIVGALFAELARSRTARAAWRGTVSASTAAVYTIGIELMAALLAAGTWLVGAIAL